MKFKVPAVVVILITPVQGRIQRKVYKDTTRRDKKINIHFRLDCPKGDIQRLKESDELEIQEEFYFPNLSNVFLTVGKNDTVGLVAKTYL